jgi:hypothetical protein
MKVLIVSDVRLHREGVACLIDRPPAVTMVGAIDLESALRPGPKRASNGAADIVLIDPKAARTAQQRHDLWAFAGRRVGGADRNITVEPDRGAGEHLAFHLAHADRDHR